MKRVFTVITLLALACTSAMASFINVKSGAEFKEAVTTDNSAEIQLTDNIDLSGIGTINITFSGKINGMVVSEKGDTTVYYIGNSETKSLGPIFKSMNNAQITNLGVEFYRCETDGDDMGVFAQTATGTHFTNVILSRISIFVDDNNGGAAVGQAKDCTFTNVQCINCDISIDGHNAGGLVGLSSGCTYDNCLNNAMSWLYSNGTGIPVIEANAGGLVGNSTNDKFFYCVNLATIGASDDQVGGIAGVSKGSSFTMCMNGGKVVQTKTEEEFKTKVGEIQKLIKEYYNTMDTQTTIYRWTMGAGITALFASGVAFLIASNPVTVAIAAVTWVAFLAVQLVEAIIFLPDSHDELGGICGHANNCAFSACTNYGDCYSLDQSSGGIVGYAEFGCTFDDCFNRGKVYGYDNVGGIIGESTGGYLQNCFNMGEVYGQADDHQYGPIIGYDSNKNVNLINCYYEAKKYDNSKANQTAVTKEQIKSGQVTWWLNTKSKTEPWQQNLGVDDVPVLNHLHPKNVYTSREVNGHYGTIVLPYDIESNDSVRFFTLNEMTDDESQLRFKKVEVLKAGTPALFAVTKPGTYDFRSNYGNTTFDYSTDYMTVGFWTMCGWMNPQMESMVVSDEDALKSLYYVSDGKVTSATKELTVKPFRAYFDGPTRTNSSLVKSFTILYDDNEDATNIKLIPADDDSYDTYSDGIFNLAGQRLSAPQKGVNIINGKKVLIK